MDKKQKNKRIERVKRKGVLLFFHDWRIKAKILFLAIAILTAMTVVVLADHLLMRQMASEDMDLIQSTKTLGQSIQNMSYGYVRFLAEDDDNLDFYTSGTSPNLDTVQNSEKNALEQIEKIQNHKTYSKLKTKSTDSELIEIQKTLSQFENQTMESAKISKERGFIAVGKVSELNASANALFASLQKIDDPDIFSYMFMLKKYETTYLVGRERIMATKLLIELGDVDEMVKEQPDDIKKETLLRRDRYKKIFSELKGLNELLEETRYSQLNVAKNMINQVEVFSLQMKEKLDQHIENEMAKGKIFAFLVTLISLLFAFFIARFISISIQRVNMRLFEMSQGGGDLTPRLAVESDEELGTLARLFNEFMDHISYLVRKTKGHSVEIAHSSEKIHMATAHANDMIAQVSGEMRQIVSGLHTTTAALRQTDSGIDSLSSSTSKVSKQSTNAAQNMGTMVSASHAGMEKLESAVEAIFSVEKQMSTLFERLESLYQFSEEIHGAVELVHNLSKRTGLLALNASIEAARAGEAGRGFNVVATEIRHLADESQMSSKVMSEVIEKITSGITGVHGSMKEELKSLLDASRKTGQTKQDFESILQITQEIDAQMQNIKKASQEQETVFGESAKALHSLFSQAEKTEQSALSIEKSMEKQGEALSQIEKAIEQLQNVSFELTETTGRFQV